MVEAEVIEKIKIIWQLYSHLGFNWLFKRLAFTLKRKSRLLYHQIPLKNWENYSFKYIFIDSSFENPEVYYNYRCKKAPSFFFKPSQRIYYQALLAKFDKDNTGVFNKAVGLADSFRLGEWPCFSGPNIKVGCPPDWFKNPYTDEKFPDKVHWSDIDEFEFGDIKTVWEMSRFGFTYALVRAFWRTGDYNYAKIYWEVVEDWLFHNPPQHGPNWKCGQEISFRTMAVCFGLYGFLRTPNTTPDRIHRLARMVYVSGQRIEANINYALNQKNNHGLSEAAGLWTIGVLFPELRGANIWRQKGADILEDQACDLIYDDGSFSQHSTNYHRLVLHILLWVLVIARCEKISLSSKLIDKFAKAIEWLYQIQDNISGYVPNYGANDGALILPLNNCDYRDFRPVIQAGNYFLTGQRLFDCGPWDEDLVWLFGPEAVNSSISKIPRSNYCAEDGGYYTFRSNSSWAFIRCPHFHHRPSHADALHLDLWWKGHNVVQDAGTFSYNSPPPWDNSLARTAVHNTITIDNFNQMYPVGRFLWLPWLEGRVRFNMCSRSGHITYWEGEHNGYLRLKSPVRHRRAVIHLGEDVWLILDVLNSYTDHTIGLHWLLADVPYLWEKEKTRLDLYFPEGNFVANFGTSTSLAFPSIVRCDPISVRGWVSYYYHHVQPALSFSLVAQGSNVLLWSLFGPVPCQLKTKGKTITIKTSDLTTKVVLNSYLKTNQPIAKCVIIDGMVKEHMMVGI